MKVPEAKVTALADHLNLISSDQDRARALVTKSMDDAALLEMAIAENISITILRSVSRSLPPA